MTARHRVGALVAAAMLLALAATWLTPAPAYACSCVTDSEPELIANAGVIFTGTVSQDRAVGQTRTYTFAVDRVYKGEAHATQLAETPVQSPACGLELSGPGPFLVLGYLDQGRLQVNSCGGTRPGGPPVDLGAGYPPQPGSATTGLTWTPTSSGLTIAVGAGCIGLALVVARRRR